MLKIINGVFNFSHRTRAWKFFINDRGLMWVYKNSIYIFLIYVYRCYNKQHIQPKTFKYYTLKKFLYLKSNLAFAEITHSLHQRKTWLGFNQSRHISAIKTSFVPHEDSTCTLCSRPYFRPEILRDGTKGASPRTRSSIAWRRFILS